MRSEQHLFFRLPGISEQVAGKVVRVEAFGMRKYLFLSRSNAILIELVFSKERFVFFSVRTAEIEEASSIKYCF